MIYTVGCGAGRKALPVSTITAIVDALKIERVLDWRKSPDGNPSAEALRSNFNGQYRYVGDRCNTDRITPSAINALAAIKETTLLLFEEPAPGDCARHADLALPLAQRTQVAHIFADEVIEAAEFQRSIDEDDDYQFTSWRPEVPAAPLEPIALPANITVQAPASVMDQAICVSVNLGRLGNTRKISSSQVEVDADKDLIRVSKTLLDSAELKAIQSLDGEIRKTLYNVCLPSMFRGGVYLVPIKLVEHVDKKLREFQVERGKLVAAFVKAYPSLIETAATRLRGVFNTRDYPTVDRVAGAFVFDWQYVEFGTPGRLREINANLFAREREKAERQWAEASDAIQETLRASMADLVNHMVDRLSGTQDGKPKVFRNSLIGNMQEFLGLFDARNITNDAALSALVQRAKDAIKGIDADAIRDNTRTRQYVANAFSQIKGALDGMMQEKPKRAYRLDEEE